MRKIIIASLAFVIAGCGPSEQEIQARIDKEVAQKIETLKAEMKADKIKEQEAAAAAEEALKKVLSGKVLSAVERCNQSKFCSYRRHDNYNIFRIKTKSRSFFDKTFSHIVSGPLELPPNVLAKLNSSVNVEGLQEEFIEGGKVSWDLDYASGHEMLGHVRYFWESHYIIFNVII